MHSTLNEMWAPPVGVLSLLQFLPVSEAQRRFLLWLWLKEVSPLWCVSPVAYHPPALPGGRMVSVCVFVRDRVPWEQKKCATWTWTEYCVGDLFDHHTYNPWFVRVPGSELKSDRRLKILSGGRQLQISSAERTDAASYTCTASSAAGTSVKEYSLQVYGTLVPPYLWHTVTKVISVVILPFITEKEGLHYQKNKVTVCLLYVGMQL